MGLAGSVDLVEEVDELLEVYFIAGLDARYLYHCCRWSGLRHLLLSSSSEMFSLSSENTTFKSSLLMYPFLHRPLDTHLPYFSRSNIEKAYTR